jgi:hypothetical protein
MRKFIAVALSGGSVQASYAPYSARGIPNRHISRRVERNNPLKPCSVVFVVIRRSDLPVIWAFKIPTHKRRRTFLLTILLRAFPDLCPRITNANYSQRVAIDFNLKRMDFCDKILGVLGGI